MMLAKTNNWPRTSLSKTLFVQIQTRQNLINPTILPVLLTCNDLCTNWHSEMTFKVWTSLSWSARWVIQEPTSSETLRFCRLSAPFWAATWRSWVQAAVGHWHHNYLWCLLGTQHFNTNPFFSFRSFCFFVYHGQKKCKQSPGW